jgi:hypothetical protein
MKKYILICTLFLGICGLKAQPVVDLALYLSVDVSGSIDATEYGLQLSGYAQAFQSATIKNLFDGTGRSMAISYSEWSSNAGGNDQGWTIIDSADDSQSFGDQLAAITTRSAVGSQTAIGTGINYASTQITNGIGNDFLLATDARVVLDISGDGASNFGTSPSTARDAALAADVDTINGIVIGSETLRQYYVDNVIGGDDPFAVAAANFADFGKAIERKIFFEITDGEIPEPTTIGLLGMLSIGGYLFLRRRKQPTAEMMTS